MSDQTPSPETPVSSGTVIDVFDLEAQARDMAVDGQPGEREQAYSAPERNVKEYFEHRHTARNQNLKDHAVTIRHDISLASQGINVPSAKAAKDQFITSGVELFREAGITIKELVSDDKQQDAEHRRFRQQHGLVHKASYPLSQLRYWSIILALAIFETAINSSMFINSAEYGILGAMGTAAAFAFTNVLLASFCGYFPLRYLKHRHKNTSHQIWAWPAFVISVSLLLLVAAYSAHYRQLLGTYEEVPPFAVLQHLSAQPLDVNFASWALAVFTVAFAVICIIKALYASDYPGYERVHRRLVEARDATHELQRHLCSDIDNIRDQLLQELTKPLDEKAMLTDRIVKSIAAFEVRQERYEGLDQSDLVSCDGALHHFRSRNLSTRTDGVMPPSFTKVMDFTPFLSANLSFQDPNPKLAKVVMELEAAQESVAARSDEIRALTEKAKDQIDEVFDRVAATFTNEGAMPSVPQLRAALALEDTPSPVSKSTVPTEIPVGATAEILRPNPETPSRAKRIGFV